MGAFTDVGIAGERSVASSSIRVTRQARLRRAGRAAGAATSPRLATVTETTDAAARAPLAGRTLIKGHGAQNDFLLLVDPEREVDVSAAEVAALCDRRAGIGADGFVRVVRTAALPGAQSFHEAVPEAEWFMDYYNADGSVAEMCGNASRLFAAVLNEEGLASIADGESITIGTRGGARTLTRAGELWTVDMGPARLIRPDGAVADLDAEGWDTTVVVPGLEGERAALSVAMPNPHTVVALATEAELESALFAGLTDSDAPDYDPRPPSGTNLELVVPLADEPDGEGGAPVGRARMRVLERGVGETRSCGTGCCAVAVALHEWSGEDAPEDYLIDTPGGRVGVHVGADPWAPGATVLLTGPAQIVARLVLPPERPAARPGREADREEPPAVAPLKRIMARIAPFSIGGGIFRPRPLLTIEEFFDGNDVDGSIWCNLIIETPQGTSSPTPAMAREVLEQIRSRPEVDDLRVAVSDIENPDWPFSEEVILVTDVDATTVRKWFYSDVAPDAIRGISEKEKDDYEDIGVPASRMVMCWWD